MIGEGEAIEIAGQHMEHVVGGPHMNYAVDNTKIRNLATVDFQVWERGEEPGIYRVKIDPDTKEVMESRWL